MSTLEAAPVLDVAGANEALRRMTAEDRVRWAAERFGDGAVMLASMQKTSSVLLHIFHTLGLKNEVLFVDTGFHFHETLELRDRFMREYGLHIVTLYPEFTPAQQEKKFGLKLHEYIDGQPDCCRMRKEEPFIKHIREHGRKLVMVGLMRSEGGRRGQLEPLMKDPRIGGHTLHPILDWDEADVAEYLERHKVPVHPLHAQAYPSIGCQVCTTPVEPGEDPRAGRWRHLREAGSGGPRYCGLNFTDGSGI